MTDLRTWWNKLDNFWIRVFKMELKPEFVSKVDRDTYTPSDEDLRELINRESIELSGVSIATLDPLLKFTHLHHLGIHGLDYLKSIDAIRELKALKSLSVALKPMFQSVVSELTYLESLSIWGEPMTDLTLIKPLKNLKRLKLSAQSLVAHNDITNFTRLEELTLTQVSLNTIEPLGNLVNLKKLTMENGNATSLEPIQSLKNLEELTAINLPLQSLTGLENLTGLTKLDLHQSGVKSLEPLSQLKQLNSLNILTTSVRSLQPILNLHQLKELHLDDWNFTLQEMQSFKKALPNCKIVAGRTFNPFHQGERYQIMQSFSSRNNNFEEGQRLVYLNSKSNVYDSLDYFYFHDPTSNETVEWEVRDDHMNWSSYMRMVSN
jgi:hypothetical protein